MPILPFTNPYVTQEQVQAIVDILVLQCNSIEQRNNDNQAQYPNLYDADYMSGRGHGDTGAVYAGFQTDTVIPDMTITKRHYGRIHCQPEIESDTAIVQIYSGDASLNIEEIRNKCATYNTQASAKRFCIIQFRMSERGHLTSVDLLTLDHQANVTLKEPIYRYRARIMPAIAS